VRALYWINVSKSSGAGSPVIKIELTLNLGMATGKINSSPVFLDVHNGVLIEQALI